MRIDFTDQECYLLLQTVESSSYSGKLAELVLSVLEKLREKMPDDSKQTGDQT